MTLNDSIESVEVVDALMSHFRNGVKPDDELIVRAYELGINTMALKQYMEEANDSIESEDDAEETGWWE